MVESVSAADLAECDREAIHLSGAIRPGGCLLCMDTGTFEVQFVSGNIGELLSATPGDLLGTPLVAHLPERLWRELQHCIAAAVPERRSTVRLAWPNHPQPRSTLVSLVPDAALVLVEVLLQEDSLAEVNDRMNRVMDWAALEDETNTDALMQRFAEMIRSVTEFDRVMVYQFNQHDGAGHVNAEACRADMAPFLGMHYPASDIPAQARQLFVRNRVRVIEDVGYAPVALHGHGMDAAKLDLSLSHLRSVSPVHLRYLDNMGVGASLAISLVRGGKLWGLVACHHNSPRPLPPAMLSATMLMSQLLSVLCERADRATTADRLAATHTLITEVVDAISQDPDGMAVALVRRMDAIMAAVNASGAAVVDQDHVATCGDAPSEASLRALHNWLLHERQGSSIDTHCLGRDWAGAVDCPDLPPGLLAQRYSNSTNGWLLCFRPEQKQTIVWAGHPEKPVERDSDGRLRPRGSFDAWEAERRGEAQPWADYQVDAIRSIRHFAVLDPLSTPTGDQIVGGGRFLGSIHDPVIVVDLQGKVCGWNHSASQLLEFNGPIGAMLTESIDIAPQRELPDLLARAVLGQVWVGEYQRSGPPPLSYEVALMPVPGEMDRRDVVAVTLRDVTERKVLQEQLHQARKMEALGQLTGGVAHNFNNLLTVILGAADMVIDQVDPADAIMSDLMLLRSTCEDASKIVRDLMAFSRQDRTVVNTLDVCECIAQLSRLLKRTITTEIRIEANLPASPLWVRADRGQLEQVLMNLVLNARDSITGPGTITLRAIQTNLDDNAAKGRGVPAGAYVQIDVADSGAGIPGDIINRIFEPFFTTKDDSGGTGLGLSSSYGIINNHSGHLSVQSEEGVGTTFTVLLPAGRHAVQAAEVEAEPDPKTANKVILVVDDEPAMREVLTRAIANKGHEVRAASSAQEALALIKADQEHRIDLLISDQMMPNMVGTDLVAETRALRPKLPVVLMSGHSKDDWPVEAQHQRFLQKPFRLQALGALIDDLLG